MIGPRAAFLAAALVVAGSLVFAGPSLGTHSPYQDQAVSLANKTLDHLDVQRASSVDLTNVTLTNYLYINNSQSIRLTNVTVGTSFELKSSSNVRTDTVRVAGGFYIQKVSDATFARDTYDSDVYVEDSTVHFDRATFKTGISCQNATVTSTNGGPSCSTSTATPTVPPPTTTYVTDPTTSPTPTNGTTYTTYTYEPTYTTHYPPPTYTVPPPTNEKYVFHLEGEVLYQDVFVYAAEEVHIRDSTIYGSLYVSWSTNVFLEGVTVAGEAIFDQSSNLDIRRLTVEGMFGISYGTNFRVVDAKVAASLGCFRCVHGLYENVAVGGEVMIVESQDIQEINVRSRGAFTYSPEPPKTTGVAGRVALRVENSSLDFSLKQEVSVAITADLRLNVSAAHARATLELPSSKRADHSAVQLESRFEKLREFEDRDGNGAYDLADLVVREYVIEELPIAGIEQERLGGDAGGWKGRIDYELPGGGTLGLVFFARDDNPNSTKIDIEIHDYRYATPHSQLALQVRLESAHDWIVETVGDEDRLTFFGEGVNGFFSWIRTAQADGRTTDVTARVLEEHRTQSGAREIVLYLGYARATDIVHDPAMGILGAADFELPTLGNLLVYGSTLLAVVVVLWALGQTTRRRVP